MSSESSKKSKDALTTLVGITLFVCFMSLESGAVVIEKPILNVSQIKSQVKHTYLRK